MSSRIGYAGLVLATGLGWLLLLDLSANGASRQPLSRALSPGPPVARHAGRSRCCCSCASRWRAASPGACRSPARRRAPPARRLGAAGAAAAIGCWRRWPCSAFGFALRQPAPADLGARPRLADRRRRVVLLPARRAAGRAPGAHRRRPASRSGATSGRCCSSSLVLVGAMLRHARHGAAADRRLRRGRVPRRVGRDVVAPAQRRTRWPRSCLAVGAVRAVDRRASRWRCSQLGSIDDVTAARLENLAAPLASANDQLALVTWFQRAAPAAGLRPRRRAVVRLRARPAAAAACRRRSRATTRSPRSSACSARRRPGRWRSAARCGCTG